MVLVKQLIGQFASWLLKLVGTEFVIFPPSLEKYREEILQLVKEEAKQVYHTDDILGDGYFKGRRVMSVVRKKYSEIKVRDLWKAVDILSEKK